MVQQEEMTEDTVEQEYQEFGHIPRVVRSPPVVLVNRNQDPDQVIRQVRHDAAVREQNLEVILERIIVQNGVSSCLQRPTYSSPLPDFILQTELPRGWKVLKFTKFTGDTEESTVEPRLISLKELVSIKRKVAESIDKYLNRFRLLKARCFTQVPEHELVEIAVRGLDYSIRKKLDTQYLRDMAQLADRVRRIERLKAEKCKVGRYHKKKEKVSYIAVEGGSSDDEDIVDRSEVNMAELKPGPPYTCKVFKPSNGKNPVELERIDKYVAKTYMFDMSK
ncbi:uncharacterized protein LOC127123561 [Lathyrus oleraceus]|uniref:uncharacterized protein LOC127123561 n=1 Tax=Pisum sativum TaxID=3888 RepID=UPI0021CFDDE6|nr:uncharacterized protein LOC127123561 [Pisum sativum]